jgi:hypothetical protein
MLVGYTVYSCHVIFLNDIQPPEQLGFCGSQYQSGYDKVMLFTPRVN